MLQKRKRAASRAADPDSHPQDILIPLDVLRDRRLTSTAKIVYGIVRSFAGTRHNHYSPTLHQISMRSNIGSVVVIRTIKNLAQAGYIRVHKDHGGRRNRYEFLR